MYICLKTAYLIKFAKDFVTIGKALFPLVKPIDLELLGLN